VVPDQHQQAGPAPRTGPSTSDLLANRYVLEERVAVGGMAAVWRAHDEVLARTVAVKVLHDDLCRQEVIRERFRREAVAAAKLVHPGIVSLFDTGVDDGRVYLVIEYVDGRTLADVLADGPLEPGEVARIGSRIAAALAHAHDRGIVHRDIKPANVLVSGDGSVKVTDFGIAKAAEDSTLTATGRVMGTAAYVAPEQLRGQPVDARTDLYSLGLVLFEAVTGHRAFAGDDPVAVAEARLASGPLRPRQRRADVPRPLDDLVAALTARDPEGRPATAAEVATALRALETPVAPPPAPRGDADVVGADGSMRGELRWLVPVCALLLLAAALVSVGIFGGVPDRDQVTSLFVEEVTPTPRPAAADDEGDPEPATQTVPLTDLTAYDPQGDGDERGAFLANVVDGAPSTVWATERYNTPQFGNLKEGVGFHVDLGAPRALSAVTLDVPRGGFDLEIRVAGRIAPDPDAWTTVVTIDDIETGSSTHPVDGGRMGQYLLVWITGDLQPFEGGFHAEIGEIRVSALAS
jgi:tRNA A-37 threonylcarbamoyl transferase component Bud32